MLIGQQGDKFILSSALKIPSNSHLIINGTLFLAAGANSHIMDLGSSSNIIIEGSGILDGNRANQSSPTWAARGGIVAENIDYTGPGANNVLVRNITIQKTQYWPWNIISSSGVRFVRVRANNCGSSDNFAAGSNNCWAIQLRNL